MATNAQARTISANAASNKGILDITSLVLLAVLLAAGFILNMTVGNALAATGIKPQFIIAAYALAIALTQASFAQAAIFGILSAAVIQITTSIPGLNFVTELAGARGPDDADEISLGHVERDVLKRLLGLRAIGERDIVDADDRFHGYLS